MLIEQAMIFALGFLAALLTVLFFLPSFWRRAVRLSVRRVAEQMPLSMAEIAAERDGLRAEGAIVQRRLEQERDRALQAHANFRAEHGRMAVKVVALEQVVDAHRMDASDLEKSLADARITLQATEAALAAMRKDHYDASGLLERANRSVGQLRTELQSIRDVSDQRRVSIASLETRVEGLQVNADGLAAALRDAERALAQKLDELQLMTRSRDEARTEVVRLQGRRAELDARVTAQSAQIARLEHTGDGSVSVTPEDDRYLAAVAKRDETIRIEASRFAQLEAQLKRQILEHREAEHQLTFRVESLRSEKYAVETELEAARRDRDVAQRELRVARAAGGLPGTASSGLPGTASSNVDNDELALLRQSIVEVAADVVRLMGNKDAGAGTQANVLHLRRERTPGGPREPGRPGGPDQPSTASTQVVGAKLI